MANLLEELFPGLAQGVYAITNARSRRYNCIAWAAADQSRWWWPGPDEENEYWPDAVAREETLEAFQALFASLGYEPCDAEAFESGCAKVALFANENREPKHAARQLSSGRWTSKLGAWEDIEHALHDLDGDEYGAVVLIMMRAEPVA
jgi:hypothetical protein